MGGSERVNPQTLRWLAQRAAMSADEARSRIGKGPLTDDTYRDWSLRCGIAATGLSRDAAILESITKKQEH